MHSTLKAGLGIGVLCGFWEFIMAMTGWITHPSLMKLFYLVILIQVAVLIWGLKQSAAAKSYGGQVLTGTVMSGIAGAFLFVFSLLLTTVLFPNLIGEMRVVQSGILREAGRTEAEISASLRLQTPLIQAFMGLAGTVVTGILASLVIAAFARKKDGVTASAAPQPDSRA
jgi:hypothetical protein